MSDTLAQELRPMAPTPFTRHRHRGFTLIELMIAIVVVAILAAVALPSFLGSIKKGRRSDAFTALSNVQQMQERWRGNNQAYASDLTAAWPAGLGLSTTTGSNYYTIAISGASATGYEATATAVSSKSQATDGNCAKLGVRMQAGTLTYAGASLAGTLAYANTHPCWSR